MWSIIAPMPTPSAIPTAIEPPKRLFLSAKVLLRERGSQAEMINDRMGLWFRASLLPQGEKERRSPLRQFTPLNPPQTRSAQPFPCLANPSCPPPRHPPLHFLRSLLAGTGRTTGHSRQVWRRVGRSRTVANAARSRSSSSAVPDRGRPAMDWGRNAGGTWLCVDKTRIDGATPRAASRNPGRKARETHRRACSPENPRPEEPHAASTRKNRLRGIVRCRARSVAPGYGANKKPASRAGFSKTLDPAQGLRGRDPRTCS